MLLKGVDRLLMGFAIHGYRNSKDLPFELSILVRKAVTGCCIIFKVEKALGTEFCSSAAVHFPISLQENRRQLPLKFIFYISSMVESKTMYCMLSSQAVSHSSSDRPRSPLLRRSDSMQPPHAFDILLWKKHQRAPQPQAQFNLTPFHPLTFCIAFPCFWSSSTVFFQIYVSVFQTFPCRGGQLPPVQLTQGEAGKACNCLANLSFYAGIFLCLVTCTPSD